MNWRKILIGALIVIGLAVVAFFGLRSVHAFRHLLGHGPWHGKPPAASAADVSLIRDWMTVPYVAHLYHVPGDVIFHSLKIPKNSANEKKSLAQLNKAYYPNQPGAVLADVQAVMQALQRQEPPPKFPATPAFTPTATP